MDLTSRKCLCSLATLLDLSHPACGAFSREAGCTCAHLHMLRAVSCVTCDMDGAGRVRVIRVRVDGAGRARQTTARAQPGGGRCASGADESFAPGMAAGAMCLPRRIVRPPLRALAGTASSPPAICLRSKFRGRPASQRWLFRNIGHWNGSNFSPKFFERPTF